jgi:hypothetical protein
MYDADVVDRLNNYIPKLQRLGYHSYIASPLFPLPSDVTHQTTVFSYRSSFTPRANFVRESAPEVPRT